MIKVLVFLAIVAVASGFVCLISPHQRGSLAGYNKAAADDCGLLVGPCGGRAPQPPEIFLPAGRNFSVVFQKNLDHYFAANPGKFVIFYERHGQSGSYRVLKEIPDTSTPSLTLYIEDIIVPMRFDLHAVIGVQYVTNGPTGEYYQCADVSIVA